MRVLWPGNEHGGPQVQVTDSEVMTPDEVAVYDAPIQRNNGYGKRVDIHRA